jgi:nucleotide-binding universal stress UspA family protein
MAAGKTSDVILLRVDESDQVYIPKPYEKSFDFEALARIYREEVKQYLNRIQADFAAGGYQVRTEFLKGPAAQSISNYAREQKVDLIVIATHGRTGISRLMFGSVALQILHDSTAPILLIRPDV